MDRDEACRNGGRAYGNGVNVEMRWNKAYPYKNKAYGDVVRMEKGPLEIPKIWFGTVFYPYAAL